MEDKLSRRGEKPLAPRPPLSPHTPIERKPMAHAVGFLSIQSPNAACPRRLCQPPWTQPTRRKPLPPFRRNHLRRSNQPKRQPLFGREGSGGRGASLREAASPPRNSAIPPPASLRKGVRGRTLLYREVFSPANHYFFSSPCFRAAPTKSRKRGWGRLGRLFSSGWN